MSEATKDRLAAPQIVDRSTFQAGLDALRVREKAHTKAGDALASWPRWEKGQHSCRIDGRPNSQWPRLNAGISDDLGTGGR